MDRVGEPKYPGVLLPGTEEVVKSPTVLVLWIIHGGSLYLLIHDKKEVDSPR